MGDFDVFFSRAEPASLGARLAPKGVEILAAGESSRQLRVGRSPYDEDRVSAVARNGLA